MQNHLLFEISITLSSILGSEKRLDDSGEVPTIQVSNIPSFRISSTALEAPLVVH